MFRAKTVLVVGAGASEEFGFPLGGALLRDVAKRIDISFFAGRIERGDRIVADALRNALDAKIDATSYHEHLQSAGQLAKSSKQGLSIDNVLDALEDDRASRVGKFGIVRSILAAEESCALSKWTDHDRDQIDINTFSHTWLDRLTKILTEGRRKSQIPNIFDNLIIINFNYDRIIEHYLPFAIGNYYGVTPAEVREVMPALQIYRPYGKAGSLPWEKADGHVAFGRCRSKDVEVAAQQILTFTEQVQDADLVSGIRSAIRSADRIAFLGFGYHRQNLELLESIAPKHVEVCGTSFGMSQSDTHTVSEELEKLFGLNKHMVLGAHNYVKLHPLECATFISEIRRTLTGGPGDDPTMELPELPTAPVSTLPSMRELRGYGNRS